MTFEIYFLRRFMPKMNDNRITVPEEKYPSFNFIP